MIIDLDIVDLLIIDLDPVFSSGGGGGTSNGYFPMGW